MARCAITENGWPSIWRDVCETIAVPGTRNVRIERLRGDVAVVLAGFMAWINRNVRPIEPADGHRNWWGQDNSCNNAVANSNHYSGTCFDFCADELPWTQHTTPQNQIDLMHRGLALWEGLLFCGGAWNRVDEMHVQLAGNTFDNPKLHEFADRLRNGYLGLFRAPDPNEFPLPVTYYYGRLEGPIESISCEYATDSQAAKDGLGRWQSALGPPVTKRWNDGITPKAAYTLQKAKGWPPNPLFGYGGVYPGEWNAVIREGWRLPAGWRADDVTIPGFEYPLTKWGDYSQYNSCHIDDSYPYRVVSFRASVADATATDPGSPTGKAGTDAKWLENMRRARKMVETGKLKKVIGYQFWVPGLDNWGALHQAIEDAGGVFPELAIMLDLESGGAKWAVRGDQSVGVLDFLAKAKDYLANADGVALYVNFTANPDVMPADRIPPGLKIIVPRYHGPDDPPQVPAGVTVFGHQYADNENTAPFGDSDINQAKLPLSQFISAWGTNSGLTGVPERREADVTTPHAEGLSDDDRALLEEVRDLLAKRALAKRAPARKAPARQAGAKSGAKKVPAKRALAKKTARARR
jgi:hypothetical protein